MNHNDNSQLPLLGKARKRICLSCGGGLPPRHRRYCSNACRQQLLATLNRRTGLLRALSTRYATFYFTDFVIVMDLITYGNEQIYSYMLPRSLGRKPVDDFCDLSNILGTEWWNERNRTKKRYVASQHVLDKASKGGKPARTVIPSTLAVPSVGVRHLMTLELSSDELTPSNMQNSIKRAYRNQVKRHHPDLGGSAQAFLKIQEAYERLIHWTKNPTYIRRSGFPDKWLYEGANQRWLQPIVPRRTR